MVEKKSATVRLPPQLWKEVKILAARQGRTLSKLVEESLTKTLREDR